MSRIFLLVILLSPLYVVSQQKNAVIHIEQDGTIYPVSGQEISLKKQPFRIVVTLRQLEGVYLFAGFTDSIYRLDANQKIPDFENIPRMTMAEPTFNEDQELIISSDGWAYWFYNEKTDWHRFDKNVQVNKDAVTGTKTIKQFYFPPTERTMPVSEVKEPLYLFFMAVDTGDKAGKPGKELMRVKARINWQ